MAIKVTTGVKEYFPGINQIQYEGSTIEESARV